MGQIVLSAVLSSQPPKRVPLGWSIGEAMVLPVRARTPTPHGLVTRTSPDDKDPLDDYIEAHVHGTVDFTRNTEALVLDPCYRGTPTESAARRLPCPIEWHGGFTLTTTELRRHPGYRGQQIVDLGASLARNGRLDPRILGDASRTGQHDEQALKRVWHYVARYGSPDVHNLTRS